MPDRHTLGPAPLTALAAAALCLLPPGVRAQDRAARGPGVNVPGWDEATRSRSVRAGALPELDAPLVETAGPYVVVHLRENRVYLFDGPRAVWSAPAGTGTGFRLERGEHRWTFRTPEGLFRIRRIETDPVWEAPDWYYVERGLPVPGRDDPVRRIPGVMGNTALYLGDGLAIHGTDRPELLLRPDPDDRRVSHGCIRLTNEDARELMRKVKVGTPVLIF
ncbi:MAG: murein L,D-transpeptidase [Gemmatimonadetes bacterium]|nr:MAG: murein L,D-transpeptidase [Gemmatimonadota bacterium]